jgi:alpha-D-xyloside xylohydrolase
MRQALALLSLLAIVGCGDDDVAPVDAGRTPTPLTLRASNDTGAIVVETDPLRLRVERPDGTAVLTSALSGALEWGAVPGGSARYHEPTEPNPPGVRFHALDLGIAALDATSATIADDEGRRGTLTLTATGPGVFTLRLAHDPAVADVALVRARMATDDGAYHGLGERFGHADARGTIVPMQFAIGGTASGLNEHHVPVPFVVSTEGYGIFARTREAGAFDVGATSPDELRATFEGADLELNFYVDPDPGEVVAKYTRDTGLPLLPPYWASAPMHWRNEWATEDVAREDSLRIRTEDVPCTTFWIDNPWQTSYNDLVIDETRFPDADAFLAELRARGYMVLFWSTPYLDAVDAGAAATNEAERLFLVARDAGYFIRTPAGEPFLSPSSPGARGGMLDFTSDATIAFWQARITTLIGRGARAFKLDYGEDVLVEMLGARTGLQFSDGTTERQTHNLYNILYHTPYRRALDAASPDGGFLLVRASTWGGQSVADLIWPGDLDNDLREGLDGEVGGLPAAVTALVSLAASGFPSFASDTGGYRGGMPTRETLLRWAEHTAFTPFLQLGGGGDHHNPWLYDAEAGAIYQRLARAHMDLVPYFRMYAARAATTGRPPLAHAALAFPSDPGSRLDPYAYLLGDDVFVAPVILPDATTREVHVPPGTWFHWFTGERFTGPSVATIAAPLGTPPVLLRQGALLPLLPEDVDTLVPVDDPAIVDRMDRPFLRALSLPAERRSVTTEEGLTVTVERVASGFDVDTSVAATATIHDLRLRVLLDRASSPITAIATVSADGTPVLPAADLATVAAGCDGACWAQEGTVLALSLRSTSAVHVEAR